MSNGNADKTFVWEILAAILIVVLAFPIALQFRDSGHNVHHSPRCRANLKGIGQGIALYTDVGSENWDILMTEGLYVLVDADLIVGEMLYCPISGDSYELNLQQEKGWNEDSWLVRDCLIKGPKDPSGDNGHGPGQFNFLHGDMNYVGSRENWEDLYGEIRK